MRRLLAVAVAAILSPALVPVTAHAVTLMVNGDTPSVRYQGWVDEMQLPTPPVPVALYLDTADRTYAACGPFSGACMQAPPFAIHLQVLHANGYPVAPKYLRSALYHELGHVLDGFGILGDEDRAAFLGVIGRIDARWFVWPSPRSATRTASTIPPAEQFADAVMMCSYPLSIRTRRYWRDGRFNSGNGLTLSGQQLALVCEMVASAVRRRAGY